MKAKPHSIWSGAATKPAENLATPQTAAEPARKPGLLSSLWDGARSAYHDLTAWHFEGRDARNGPAPPESEMKNGWTKMGPKETVYHDNNRGEAERKYVKEVDSGFLGLGGQEAVYDGDTDQPMERGAYQATYNYCNPAKDGLKDKSLSGIGRNLGHFALDVVPYWFGGTVRGDEGTTFGERVVGPENYKWAQDKWAGAKDFVGDKAAGVGQGLKSGWDKATGWLGSKAAGAGQGIKNGWDKAAGWLSGDETADEP